jgi:hypothetical protein
MKFCYITYMVEVEISGQWQQELLAGMQYW